MILPVVLILCVYRIYASVMSVIIPQSMQLVAYLDLYGDPKHN